MKSRRILVGIDTLHNVTEVHSVVDEGTIHEHIRIKYFNGIEG